MSAYDQGLRPNPLHLYVLFLLLYRGLEMSYICYLQALMIHDLATKQITDHWFRQEHDKAQY